MTRMTGAGLDDWNECIGNNWSDWEDYVTGMTRMTGAGLADWNEFIWNDWED